MLHTLWPLKPFRNSIVLSPVAGEIRATWSLIRRSPHWAPLAQEISRIAKSSTRPCAMTIFQEVVSIDLPAAVTPRGFESLLRSLLPWRVGPYQIGSILIDSEWRSFKKWQRLLPLLGNLQGARIADVGCSSGYFLFQLTALQPELLVGFDPVERCWLQFGLLQALTRLTNLAFVPSGIATVDGFPEFFDLVLCMGVIYHQRDPFAACKKLFAAVKPGGRVILESLVIPESGSHLMIPRERYAKMRNAWVIPTPDALVTLLTRAGFSEPELHTFGPVTTAEQRRTEWAPYESLADFLDPNDPTKTVEGYKAPHSALVVARKI